MGSWRLEAAAGGLAEVELPERFLAVEFERLGLG
jgi:hypothetical protein